MNDYLITLLDFSFLEYDIKPASRQVTLRCHYDHPSLISNALYLGNYNTYLFDRIKYSSTR